MSKNKRILSHKEKLRRQSQSDKISYGDNGDGTIVKFIPTKMNGVKGYIVEEVKH